jgi:hypothetical protein
MGGHSLVEEGKKCIEFCDAETFWKGYNWKTEKQMRVYH